MNSFEKFNPGLRDREPSEQIAEGFTESVNIQQINDLAKNVEKITGLSSDYSAFKQLESVEVNWSINQEETSKRPYLHLSQVDLGEKAELKAQIPPDPTPDSWRSWGGDEIYPYDGQWGSSESSVKSVSFSPTIEGALFGVSRYISNRVAILYIYSPDLEEIANRKLRFFGYDAEFLFDYALTKEFRVDNLDIPVKKIGQIQISYKKKK